MEHQQRPRASVVLQRVVASGRIREPEGAGELSQQRHRISL